jgi:hypothetical protein
MSESSLTERERVSPQDTVRFIRRDQNGRITISEETRRPQRDRRVAPARTPRLAKAPPKASSHAQSSFAATMGSDTDTTGDPRLEAIRDLIEQLETAAAAGDKEAAGFLEMVRAWAVRR